MPRVKLTDSSRVTFADALALLSVAREDYSLEDDTLWVSFPLVVAGSMDSYEARFYIMAAESPEQLDAVYNQRGVDAYYEFASVGSYGIQVLNVASGEDTLLVADDMVFTTPDAFASAWHIFATLIRTSYSSEEDLLQRCRRWGLHTLASDVISEVTDAAGSSAEAGVSFTDALDVLSGFRSYKGVSVSTDFDDSSVFAIVSSQRVWGYSATIFLEVSGSSSDMFSLYSANIESFLSRAYGSDVRIVFSHTTPWARIERYATVSSVDEYKAIVSQVVSFMGSLDVTGGFDFIEAVEALPFASARPTGSSSKVHDAAGHTPTPIEELLSNLLSLSLPQAAVDMIAKYQAQHGGGRTLYNSQGKELMTFAGTNSDPDTITQYSYKQHAWQRIMDSDETMEVHSLRSVLEKVLSAVKDADRRPYAAAARILLYLQQRGIEGRILDKDGVPVVIDCGGAKVSIYNTDGDGLLSIQCGGSERYFDLFAVVAWVDYLEQCLHEKKEVMDSSSDRREFIFPADSKDVTDGKGHFPIPDIAHGRNAIARVNQYSKLPKWYKGKMSLPEFVKFVVDKVEKKFPSIDVSAAAKVAKPQEVKDSDDWDEDDWDEEETPITCTTTTAYARKFADMLDDRRYDYTTSASNVFVVTPSERFRPDGIEANLHYDMTQYGIPESEVEFEVMNMDSAPSKGSKSMGMSESKVADATSVADVIAAVKKNQPGRIMSHGNIGGVGITVDPASNGSFRVSIANRGNSVAEGLKKAAESLGMQVDKDPDADDFMSTTVLFVPKDQA